MSKKVTKMNQEAENQQEVPEMEEKKEDSKLKAFGKKAWNVGKKVAPIIVGSIAGTIVFAVCSSLGQDKADEVMNNLTNALPDHGGNDFTGIGMTEENKTE